VNLVANPLGAKRDGGWRGDLDNDSYAVVPERARALTSSNKRIDYETETLIPYSLQGAGRTSQGSGWNADVSFTLNNVDVHAVAHALRADGFDASEDGTGRGTPLSNQQHGDPMHTLHQGAPHIAFGWQNSSQQGASASKTPTLDKSKVRRLTPRECERLQGFPDNYTAIPFRGKPAADGPRHKALGNSMAVPVVRWIGERISIVEAI